MAGFIQQVDFTDLVFQEMCDSVRKIPVRHSKVRMNFGAYVTLTTHWHLPKQKCHMFL